MRIVRQLTDNKFINLKEVQDPEKHIKGYQFAERLGKDSISFICWDNDSEQFLFNNEFKPPIDKTILGAFGGSMDKNKSPEQIVIDEVREEAGFEVDESAVHYVGKVMVSTQMNQFCHLYLVEVDRNDQKERQPENEVEAMAKTEWVEWSSKKLGELNDWKPLTIIFMAQAKNVLP